MTVLSAVLLSLAAWSAAAPKQAPPAAKSSVAASFEFAQPAGWTSDRREAGVLLTKDTSEGVAARIAVRYIAPGDKLRPDAAAYMKRLTKPPSVPMKGWRNGPVETVSVAGRKALRLERDTTDFAAPDSIAPREVALKEEHVAVPAAKGYYLLTYAAPRAEDAVLRLVFRRVAASFKPKL